AQLALTPGQAHSREKLAGLLWGNSGDDQARNSLRHALVALRKALPRTTPPSLAAEGSTLALNSQVVDVDVTAFERHVAEGTPAALEQAVALYRGDLLEGFAVREAPFEEWLAVERERLRGLALAVLRRVLDQQIQAGTTEVAVRTAATLVALASLQEDVHRTLMRLYARQGRRGAALRQYQVCVAILQRELATEPEPDTKRLYQEILQQPVAGSVVTRARSGTRRRREKREA